MFSRVPDKDAEGPREKLQTTVRFQEVQRSLSRLTSTILRSKHYNDDLVLGLSERALSLPQAERESFLQKACDGDSALFHEVWQYVEEEQYLKGFLETQLYSPAQSGPVFQPGERVANRFLIVREVAQGGMGIVYEALDERLDRRIAIKCAKPGFQRRLPPEVRHARTIAHPNVCKIFDVHTVSTDQGEIDFISMEFLEGETLAQRLSRGPIPYPEASAIAQQLCAGLEEAHRNGVIHGDLKSNNVILTITADRTVRAVITDFGLARGLGANQKTVQSGSVRGTPAYMAPELWKGQAASVASDIYALGVILYELASGRTPFESLSDLPLKDRLTRRPRPLKHSWRRIMERCLEPDPSRRCASVSKIAIAVAPSHRLRHWTIATAAVVMAVTVGAIVYSNLITQPKETVRLAIFPFETFVADRPLSDGLLDSTADQLRHIKAGSTHRLTVIPWADAVRNKANTPDKAAGLLGATHTLTGTLQRNGGRTIIHAYLTDARSNLPLKEWQAEYQPGVLRDMPVALAGMVTATLGLPPLTQVATVNAAAYADFVRGVGLLERNNVDEALPFLRRAVMLDSDSPLTHARLAEAEHREYELIKEVRSSGGDDWLRQAKDSLAQAESRNPDLAVVRAVSGMINKYAGAYQRAQDDYQRALQIEPLNGDVWRLLGDVYQELSQFPQAVAAYQKAMEVQPGYFKNYQAFCYLQADQANHDDAIRQCEAMVKLVPELSEAHFALSKPYLAAGRYADGERELRLATDLDPRSSKAFHALALALVYQTQYSAAIPYFRQALAIGPESEPLYLNLGTTYRFANQRSDALNAYQKALRIAEAELARNPYERTLQSHLAYLCAQLGQTSRAEFEAARALQMAPGSVEVARMIVQTYETLGERDRALALASTLPDEMLRRLSRSPDLSDFAKDSRFKQLLLSHHIQ